MGSCMSFAKKDALDESKLTNLMKEEKKRPTPTSSPSPARPQEARNVNRRTVDDERGGDNRGVISAAMQNSVAARIILEAPNDVFELIVSLSANAAVNGMGGLNTLRLVSKRFKHAAESVATKLTQLNTQASLIAPVPWKALSRCKMMEKVQFDGYCINRLERFPDGLKSLVIANARSVTTLEPLAACARLETIEMGYTPGLCDMDALVQCTRLKKLHIGHSRITSLMFLPSLPFLEDVSLGKGGKRDSFKDLSPLRHCHKLKKLSIQGNVLVDDLSPLCQCPDLQVLDISNLTLITDLTVFVRGSFSNLRVLNISYLPLKDLSPLSRLQNLEKLDCPGLPPTTSLYPLTSCYMLKKLHCMENAKDLGEVRAKMTELEITYPQTIAGYGRAF